MAGAAGAAAVAAALRPWKGVRVLLPEWRMILMRPSPEVAWGRDNPRQVRFRVQPSMNKLEIKSYLRDVYGVKVEAVSTQVVLGSRKISRTVMPGGRGGGSANRYKTPDYKIAFVTLAEDEEPFVYPDLFPDEEDESKDTSGSS